MSKEVYDLIKIGDKVDLSGSAYDDGGDGIAMVLFKYPLNDSFYAVYIPEEGECPISIEVTNWSKDAGVWIIPEPEQVPEFGDLLILANGTLAKIVSEPKNGIIKYLRWSDYIELDEVYGIEVDDEDEPSDPAYVSKLGSVDISTLEFDGIFRLWKTTT